MWAWITILLGALGPLLASTAGRVLVALGIGVATYSGVDSVLSTLKSGIFSHFASFATHTLDVLFLVRIDQGINIVFSAYLSAIAVRGLQGSITKFVHKAPPVA